MTITRQGKRAAHLASARQKSATVSERRRAISEMVRIVGKGLNLGGRRFTRGEMHEH